MSFQPTEQQERIINEVSNTVVIAKPGSGKTFVLSKKIQQILPNLHEYQGIVAISYTNKASDELKHRCLNRGLERKSSFFGTIDKFYIQEIIRPFGKHIWGLPSKELAVTPLGELPKAEKDALSWFNDDFHYKDLKKKHVDNLKAVFLNGHIILQAVGILALFIFDNSLACRNYLKARYTHIIIDEYQDSGYEQHEVFLRLQDEGLCAIAVGDADQSIYGFSGKDARYLISLRDHPEFVLYPLTLNHRSHPSIINYSTGVLTDKFQPIPTDEIRVFEKFVNGNEADTASWIDSAIPYYSNAYGVTHLSEIGILVRGNRTGKFINNNLTHNHKLFINTPLDDDSNLWSTVFARLLVHIFNNRDTKIEFMEEFFNLDAEHNKVKLIIKLIDQVKLEFSLPILKTCIIKNIFVQIAQSIFPTAGNFKSVKLLSDVLQSSGQLDSYKPALDDQVQIMTIHKSKGLEFKVVFHLDLYKWVFPLQLIDEDTRSTYYGDLEQDTNLHYVGITRAKECCILCCSSVRHNKSGQVKQGTYSEFFYNKGLDALRERSPV